MTTLSPSISQEQINQFHQDGFMIMENFAHEKVISDLIACLELEMERENNNPESQRGISIKNQRVFINNTYENHPAMRNYLFSDEMKGVCKQTLGPTAYLFFEQFVVKGPEQNADTSFAWHQDSGYIPHEHPFYLSCWLALDDMTEENGTIRVLPYEKTGGKKPQPHFRLAERNDMVGYSGPEHGIPICVKAGTLVVFSSYTLHCSGRNKTGKQRRSYLAQYSNKIILNAEGSAPHALAVKL